MSNNILKIAFNASTIDGTIVKDMTYTPSMSQPQIYSGFPNILFIPTIKLTTALFETDMGLFDRDIGEDDIKKVFLSASQLNNLLERLQEKKRYEKISLDEAKKKGIIYNNIKFILNLFFRKGERLHIYQKSYVINNYDWNNKYDDNTIINNTNTPVYKIKINISLHEGNELSFIDSARLGCLQKRNSIVADYYELVGLKKPLDKTSPIDKQPINIPQPISSNTVNNTHMTRISSNDTSPPMAIATPITSNNNYPMSDATPIKGGKKNHTKKHKGYKNRKKTRKKAPMK
jgi:hypothetical protein